ncbi:MAG TPA: ABC transporter substrate-binding protein [Pseudonocardia sp.]|jgi:peptide/nickel transport system substrate-binding protein|uniref:ABC transporter substrate-binding protein n=1 Tax=Pseudonocardia sp. TaxID=60912 RepID=UPI002B4B6A23|nr:ABC transporter substrate-binding protein [Pseudonocardia sp.]HLU59376.1 ABC transporter substrate-binding protein [Pseudonocardia sp.]
MTRFRPFRRAGVAGIGLALVGSVLAACAGASAAGGGTRVEGGTITYAHVQEPPCIFGGWIQQAYISRQVLDNLVTLDTDGSIKPWLATSWTVSPDGLTYTFTLKEGVRFTDGTPLDAEAVAFNFDQWMATEINGTAKVSLDPYYRAAEAIDPTRVAIHLNAPYPQFLTLITQGYFGIQSPTALRTRSAAENCEKPVGSGAFIVEEWRRGQEVVFKKNPDYTSWPATAKHEGPAHVDELRWKFVPDALSRYASLTTGQSDVVYEIPTVHWEDARSRFETTIRYITPGKPVSFYLNTVAGVFTDKLVRQAFAHGADRKGAVEAGFHGVIPYEGNPAVSQSTPDYDAEVAEAYPFDQARANALLDRAGWTGRTPDGIRTKDGAPLTVRLVYSPGSIFTSEGATVLQALQEQWRQVGFDVQLVPATRAELNSGRYSDPSTYDAMPSYWTSPSPAILWIVWRPSTPEKPNGNNRSFYTNPDLARVIHEANTSTDPQRASQLYRQAQHIISDDAAGVGLYTQNTLVAASNRVKDFWLEHSQGEPVFSDAYLVE